MASGEVVARGSCNCGGVKYTVTGPLREVIACHCGQCRKQTGHYYAATNAKQADVEINDSEPFAYTFDNKEK